MWSGMCDDVAALLAWMLWFALAWGPVRDAFTRALSRLPTPEDGSPPRERRGYLYPLSILVLTRIS